MSEVVNFLRPLRGGRIRRLGTGMGLGALAVGTAAVIGVGPATAGPLDELAGNLGQLPNSSADVGLTDLLDGLRGLLPSTTATGKTGCTTVIQVGDSTSVNADQAATLPAADDTASAQYRRVGATTTTVDAYSGRAIIGGPGTDAEHVVTTRLAAGERGCWVIAMGVNDAGAIAAGSSIGADKRIDAIMAPLAGQPVLWPTVTSKNPSNQAFGAAAMTAFNDALRRATTRYRNLAVYDWAAQATGEEFATDGIHYTASGTAARNRGFADALAKAYPPGVGSTPSQWWVSG